MNNDSTQQLSSQGNTGKDEYSGLLAAASDFARGVLECNPHDEDQLIATFDDIAEVWDGLKIDGKDFEEVINHSYIVALN